MLLLFFFSYARPLSKKELQAAHEKGFIRPVGSGPLPHMRHWPEKFANWADGKAEDIGKSKAFDIWDPFAGDVLVDGPELNDCLNDNWPEDLHPAIKSLLKESFETFNQSTQYTALKRKRTEVSHAQFIKILDDWLKKHSELGRKYLANHPVFEDTRLTKVCLLYVMSLANWITVRISQDQQVWLSP